jgi:hypothetical protein
VRSPAWHHWKTKRLEALDQLEAAHAAAWRGGRRSAAAQVVHAYVVLLSAQFQGFCRDLHDDGIDHLAAPLSTPLREAIQRLLSAGRKLDTGNPNPGNLGADFGRLGVELWPALLATGGRTTAQRQALEQMNAWRNAISHDSFDLMGRTTLSIAAVRRWRAACDGLASTLDRLMRAHLAAVVGAPPW